MLIDQENCTACESCIPYCPVGAIQVEAEKVFIDQDECMECGVCHRLNVCDFEAILRPDLGWPRVCLPFNYLKLTLPLIMLLIE